MLKHVVESAKARAMQPAQKLTYTQAKDIFNRVLRVQKLDASAQKDAKAFYKGLCAIRLTRSASGHCSTKTANKFREFLKKNLGQLQLMQRKDIEQIVKDPEFKITEDTIDQAIDALKRLDYVRPVEITRHQIAEADKLLKTKGSQNWVALSTPILNTIMELYRGSIKYRVGEATWKKINTPELIPKPRPPRF
jgi:hypothetical protein